MLFGIKIKTYLDDNGIRYTHVSEDRDSDGHPELIAEREEKRRGDRVFRDMRGIECAPDQIRGRRHERMRCAAA